MREAESGPPLPRLPRHRRADVLTGPGALALVEHPVVRPEGCMEPHGMIEGDHEPHSVALMGQQGCPQERVVRDVGGDAAVQLHVAFACNRKANAQPRPASPEQQQESRQGRVGQAGRRGNVAPLKVHTKCLFCLEGLGHTFGAIFVIHPKSKA